MVALLASSSGAVAKPQFLNWQNWDFSKKDGPSVSVSYVWKANYSGISFPKKRTRVFTVRGPSRSVYWRATTLDAFVRDHWREDQISVEPASITVGNASIDAVYDNSLQPDRSANPDNWSTATVHVEALRDPHLVSPSGVIAYQHGPVEDVQYSTDGVAQAPQPLPRNTQYTAWAFQPQPKPALLAVRHLGRHRGREPRANGVGPSGPAATRRCRPVLPIFRMPVPGPLDNTLERCLA